MRTAGIILLAAMLWTAVPSAAQTPLWQGKGRIAISSDGNEHDHDDWAATPLSLALLAAEGLQDHLVLYTYSDHVWGSNRKHPSMHGMSAYEHMKESALGGRKWFGFDNSCFICAVDDPERAYNAMRDAINASTESDPLIIIAAGPMQVVGEGISRAERCKLRYVTLLSHSHWNNTHSDTPDKADWDDHTGWTWAKIREGFEAPEKGGLHCVKILDQNSGADYAGFNTAKERFDWVRDSPARNNPLYKPGSWDWLYGRLSTCLKAQGKNFDPSDAGMVVYLLTGVEKTDPDMARAIMENPKPGMK